MRQARGYIGLSSLFEQGSLMKSTINYLHVMRVFNNSTKYIFCIRIVRIELDIINS